MLLASDEAYSELWFEPGDPPPSALQVGDLSNVLAINSLSKRSSMTGYRSGFAAGDPEVIGALRRLRPSVGVTPQEFVQRASVAAWNDEEHVAENRERYAAKREVFLVVVRSPRHPSRRELRRRSTCGSRSRTGERHWRGRSSCSRGAGVVVAPGSFFGPEGEGYVRMALVPTLGDCEQAASAMDSVFRGGARVSDRTDLADLQARIESGWNAGTPDAEAVEAASICWIEGR